MRFKGKKILFVGDSLSLNQWQSLTCMLYNAVPSAKYTLVRSGELSTLTFKVMCHNYNHTRNGDGRSAANKDLVLETTDCSIILLQDYNLQLRFFRNAFIVDIVRTDAGQALVLDSVNGSRQLWEDNDVLIFDSWHWWLHTGRKQPYEVIVPNLQYTYRLLYFATITSRDISIHECPSDSRNADGTSFNWAGRRSRI